MFSELRKRESFPVWVRILSAQKRGAGPVGFLRWPLKTLERGLAQGRRGNFEFPVDDPSKGASYHFKMRSTRTELSLTNT
jgi:hypothetical protein